MNKFFFMTFFFTLLSCNSELNLDNLKFDSDISTQIKQLDNLQKDNDLIYGLVAYRTNDVTTINYSEIKIENNKINNNSDNSLIDYESEISFLVDNFTANSLKGFIIKTVDENEGIQLIQSMNSTLGKPVLQDVFNNKKQIQNKFLWDNVKDNKLILIKQHTEYYDGFEKSFILTEMTVVKRDLKLTPDDDNNPEDIKKILDENPKAFEVIEIIKSSFNSN